MDFNYTGPGGFNSQNSHSHSQPPPPPQPSVSPPHHSPHNTHPPPPRRPYDLPLLNTQLYYDPPPQPTYREQPYRESYRHPPPSHEYHNQHHAAAAVATSHMSPVSASRTTNEIALPESGHMYPSPHTAHSSHHHAHGAVESGIPSAVSASVSVSPESPVASTLPSAGGSSSAIDKPLRRSGKESSNTVIACRQCRARKIRCDSTRPVCNNCTRRCNECEYDAVPKRRGPDKRPGTRQRSCKKRPPPPPDPSNQNGGPPPPPPPGGPGGSGSGGGGSGQPPTKRPRSMKREDEGGHSAGGSGGGVHDNLAMGYYGMKDRGPLTYSPLPSTYSGAYMYDESIRRTYLPPTHVASQPSLPPLPYTSDWWSDILASVPHAMDGEHASRMISADLQKVFGSAQYWLGFINVPLFFMLLTDSTHRASPSTPPLIFALLALSDLLHAPDKEDSRGWAERSVSFAERAQVALEECAAANALDARAAQAAFVLALYESAAHPSHTAIRARDALRMLDAVVRTLSLTTLDKDDPDASTFEKGSVPKVVTPRSSISPSPPASHGRRVSNGSNPMHTCECGGGNSPAWQDGASIEDTQREEARRLVWSALALAAAHTAHCAAFKRTPLDLYIARPENYALLFPGEKSSARNGSEKESVWALYCRAMLLWNACLRLPEVGAERSPSPEGGVKEEAKEEDLEFAAEAHREANAIQESLDSHTCAASKESALLYVGREHLANARIAINAVLRGATPLAYSDSHHRTKSIEWVGHQRSILAQTSIGVGSTARKPWTVWYFLSHLSIALSLFTQDQSLVGSLELGVGLTRPIEGLMGLWDCAELKRQYADLRDRLSMVCHSAGIPGPSSSPVMMNGHHGVMRMSVPSQLHGYPNANAREGAYGREAYMRDGYAREGVMLPPMHVAHPRLASPM